MPRPRSVATTRDRRDRRSRPLSPPVLQQPAADRLLAYLGNGHVGLRVGRIPLLGGLTIVNGFWGGHPKDGLPAFATAPHPLGGDLAIDGRWASETDGALRFVSQALDFGASELRSRFTFQPGDVRAEVEVVTFASRSDPALVLQEVTVRCDRVADVRLRSSIQTASLPGRWLGAGPIPRGQPPTADAWLLWEGMGGGTRCGLAIAVEREEGRDRPVVDVDPAAGTLTLTVAERAAAGAAVRLRSIAGLVPDLAHSRPERQAARLVGRGIARGWSGLREANRAAWAELWRARPIIDGPADWQARADASFFYLHSSISRASLASTGVFGLAYAPDYHYYRGHVMWDIESFAYPPLVLTDPDAARAVLRFRSRTAPAARSNAALHGYAGLQYPWEAAFDSGEEVTPRWSKTDKDHVSLDVGLAFAQYVAATGDRLFARQEALPVIAGVAEWLLSRVEPTERGYEIRRVRGPAEAFEPVDNDAFVNLAAIAFLRRAAELVRWLGDEPPASWDAIADALVIPRDRATGAIVNHDAHRLDEPLGETPEAAAAFFPLGYRDEPAVEAATLRYALRHQAERYVGTPMYSALLGVHAAWLGRRRRSAELFEEGFAAFFDDPFLAPDEFPAADARFPQASPMLANLGAFLGSLVYGLPGILPSLADPATWPERRVVLPAGWRSIEIERLWVRGRPARMVAVARGGAGGARARRAAVGAARRQCERRGSRWPRRSRSTGGSTDPGVGGAAGRGGRLTLSGGIDVFRRPRSAPGRPVRRGRPSRGCLGERPIARAAASRRR